MVSITSLKTLFFFFFLTVLTVKIVEGLPLSTRPACDDEKTLCDECMCICRFDGKSEVDCAAGECNAICSESDLCYVCMHICEQLDGNSKSYCNLGECKPVCSSTGS